MTGIMAIIDDDEAVRESTADIMRRSGHRVRTFASGDDFVGSEIVEPLSCILLDLHMPGRDGLAVLAALRDRGDASPVIVITAYGELHVAIEAMKLGACDFIEKPYRATDLLTAVKAVLARPDDAEESAARAWAVALVGRLTRRQRQVLEGMVQGLQNKVIAFELGLSTRTVEAYRSQLMEKLGTRGTAEAVRLALTAGLTGEHFGEEREEGASDRRQAAAGPR
jgi:two-component system response regulator FixJ